MLPSTLFLPLGEDRPGCRYQRRLVDEKVGLRGRDVPGRSSERTRVAEGLAPAPQLCEGRQLVSHVVHPRGDLTHARIVVVRESSLEGRGLLSLAEHVVRE